MTCIAVNKKTRHMPVEHPHEIHIQNPVVFCRKRGDSSGHIRLDRSQTPDSVSSGMAAELEMQVLLDRANFSPGEIDDENGKNSREALAAFQAARRITPGARSRKVLLAALGARAVGWIRALYDHHGRRRRAVQ